MKKIMMVLLVMTLFSLSVFANWYDDINYYKGKKVEIMLANNEKTITGVFQNTSEYMKSIIGIVICNDDGSLVYISMAEIAVIKEIK